MISVKTANPVRLGLRLAESGAAFSAACKRAACRCPTAKCELCSRCDSCAWHDLFSQALSVDPAALRRHQKPPLPFVFSFPFPDSSHEKIGNLDCGLVVIGKAIPHLEILLEGFETLLTDDDCQEPCEIARISCLDYQGTCVPLKGDGCASPLENLVVLSADELLEHYAWEHDTLAIRLLTPLRLMSDGRQIASFDFSRFARSLMRRVSSLAHYYADYEFNCDFGILSRQAADTVCTEDHFRSGTVSGGNRRLAGIMGCGSFKGNFSGLMPFLVLGSHVHIGKGAAFGLGAFEVSTNRT